MEIKVHSLAELFPLLDDRALQELADDIKQNGQQVPILACRGVIVDGRNRLKACEIAGVEPEFLIRDDMTEAEIVAAIISANLHRRHLTTQQRAHIAAELANGTWGGNRSKVSNDLLPNPPTIKEAAAALNVSEPSVKRAMKVKREDPEAHNAAMRGERQAKREPIEPTLATAATEAPKRRRPPPSEARAVVEALDSDPEAFREVLLVALDFETASDVAGILHAALSHRGSGFVLEVAGAMCTIAEQPLPPQRQLAS